MQPLDRRWIPGPPDWPGLFWVRLEILTAEEGVYGIDLYDIVELPSKQLAILRCLYGSYSEKEKHLLSDHSMKITHHMACLRPNP